MSEQQVTDENSAQREMAYTMNGIPNAQVTEHAVEAAKLEAARTRNQSPINILLNDLAKAGYVDWSSGGVLSLLGKDKDGKKIGITVPLSELVGKFTESNLTTIYNRYNPISAKERKTNDIARELRRLGMNDAADEVIAKFKAEQEAEKAAAKV